MRYALSVLLILGSLLPFPASAEDTVVFRDHDRRCSLDYNQKLFTPGALTPENYRRFSGPDADTYFLVSAFPNDDSLTPEQIRQQFLEDHGLTDVVYERTKAEFLVVSGYQGNTIFYSRIALSPNSETICALHILYPKAAKRAMDEEVTRMSLSLTASP